MRFSFSLFITFFYQRLRSLSRLYAKVYYYFNETYYHLLSKFRMKKAIV